MITKEQISALIDSGLETSHLEVLGDDGDHFEAIIVSPKFIGLNMVKRQQLVYAALGDRFQTGEIHALALKTYAPDEWPNGN